MPIKKLSPKLINRIAAGEVVERPASVVKELVENSIDAGATQIKIELAEGGLQLIRITDNGGGISKEDLPLVFERHATSKISEQSDLFDITSMGFRGEALSSIAAIAEVSLQSKLHEAEQAWGISLRAGSPSLTEAAAGKQLNQLSQFIKQASLASGTIITVRNIFRNVPARLKFLKSARTEYTHILKELEPLIFANEKIGFELVHNDKQIFMIRPEFDLTARIGQLVGEKYSQNLHDIFYDSDYIKIKGALANPTILSVANRQKQWVIVNGRGINSPLVSKAVAQGLESYIMRGQHPIFVIMLIMSPKILDVNVHPRKKEVKFLDTSGVFKLVRGAVEAAMRQRGSAEVGLLGSEDPGSSGDRFGKEELEIRELGIRDRAKEVPSRIQDSTPFHSSRSRAQSNNNNKPQSASPNSQIPNASLPEQTFQNQSHDLGETALTQLHSAYILAPDTEKFRLYDQHAVAERILYEKLKKTYGEESGSQALLTPLNLDLSAAERELILERQNEFSALGYELEEVGDGSITLRAVPALMKGQGYEATLRQILADFEEENLPADQAKLALLKYAACRGAIKAGDPLNQTEMQQLIHDLWNCEYPYACEHGRPTFVDYSWDEISHWFKRK